MINHSDSSNINLFNCRKHFYFSKIRKQHKIKFIITYAKVMFLCNCSGKNCNPYLSGNKKLISIKELIICKKYFLIVTIIQITSDKIAFTTWSFKIMFVLSHLILKIT